MEVIVKSSPKIEIELATKVVKAGGGDVKADGVYPDLTAGDLAGRGESVPAEFGFRASGGKSIKDGRAYIKRIKGNSVVWNNMVDTRGYEGGFIIQGGVTIIAGHKYLLQRSAANNGLYLIPVVDGSEKYEMSLRSGEFSEIFTSQYTDLIDARVFADAYCGACVISDLTKMFGAGNEPSTIEEYNARKPIVADEYAYNEGEVIHMNTESIKSVGDNAFDASHAIAGYMDDVTGVFTPSSDSAYSMFLIKCIAGEQYYFRNVLNGYYKASVYYYGESMNYLGYNYVSTGGGFNSSGIIDTPENAHYMRVQCHEDYLDSCMVTLVHSGRKVDTDAGYQPYWQDTLPLPIIRKYFPDGMKSAGSAHDEIRFNKASGKWEKVQRIRELDLGDLDWSYYPAADGYPYGFFYASPQGRNYGENNILCGKYAFGFFANDKSILGNSSGENIYIMDSAYTDVESFKASLQDVMLYYESKDWEWVELDAEDQNFNLDYRVADFGTEQAIAEQPSAPFSADIIYQFNAVDMIREHEIEINELQSIIATMQAQLASLINK